MFILVRAVALLLMTRQGFGFSLAPPAGSSASAVALQLHHVSESYKGGLISPEERHMWKDHIISASVGGRPAPAAAPAQVWVLLRCICCLLVCLPACFTA